jgi:hypothetical protein
MTMERQKSDDEGKKEQKKRTGEKKSSCSQFGVWNIEYTTHDVGVVCGQDPVPELQIAADPNILEWAGYYILMLW